VSVNQLGLFTRMFGAMLEAGMPMDQILRTLAEQSVAKPLKNALQRVIIDVESGILISDSMRRHSRIFSVLYCSMIAAGETSGSLDRLLGRLAEMLDRSDIVRSKIKGALVQPLILMTVGILAVMIMLIFIVPKFVVIFEQNNAKLPMFTLIAVGMSKWLTAFWWTIPLGGISAFMGVRALWRRPSTRNFMGRLVLRLPILGNIARKGATAQFCRTFSTLLTSGVVITEALEKAAPTAGNPVIMDAAMDARRAISMGAPIAPSLEAARCFDPIVISMISVGETSGRLDEMLERLASIYEREVDRVTEASTKLVEPLMTIVIAAMIGVCAAAIYLPMIDMIQAVAEPGAAITPPN
jgi:type IV pilus assembly protein PilC